MTIALATCRALPELDSDDQLLYRALLDADIKTEIAIWDDETVDWSQYEMAVIRSTWDYVPHRDAYLAWAEKISKQTALWNSPALLRWNTDKRYLKDLETEGIQIVPTVWGSAGSVMDEIALPADKEWDELVVKPAISASGNDTYKISRADWLTRMPALQSLLSEKDVMVQPFMKTVQTVGEYAFLFFNGEFSHAVLKQPKLGEFRVQEHHGGHNQPIEPTLEQRRFAEKVMQSLPESTLYARVDAIMGESGQLMVSEVEVTEPSMYLVQDKQTPARFVAAIRERLQVASPVL